MEPYRPSRWELIGDRRDWRRVGRHYVGQIVTLALVDVPRVVWKVIAKMRYWNLIPVLGGPLVFASYSLAIHLKARDQQKALRELQEVRAVTERALVNWVQWRDAFLGNQVAACFHAHDFSRGPVKRGDPSQGRLPLSYTITCQIGPQGQLPQHKVVCDQDLCKLSNLNYLAP